MKIEKTKIMSEKKVDRDIVLPKYVLITPAKNEAKFIERTLQSVINQTVKPMKWVIVSDGSTDGTDDIIKIYVSEYEWIEFIRMPERTERHFAGKVTAFNAGYGNVRELNYDIVGNLDADISFEHDYFRYLLGKFSEDSKLGVVGTPFREGTEQYDYRFSSIEHVSGACQLFRRRCFEEIGGYPLIAGGGIDLVAVTTARMMGWKTRTFTEKFCYHNRKIGTGKGSSLKAYFRFGKQDYYLGGHPIWEIFRSIYQMKSKPYMLRGVYLFAGYLWAFLIRMKRPISPQFIIFRRHEQMIRLKSFIRNMLNINSNTYRTND